MDPTDLLVLSRCEQWLADGHGVVLVTVVRTWGSSPRPPGALMALRDDGAVAGSVSGGCIEDDLIASAQQSGLGSLTPHGPTDVRTYGVSAESARRLGLPCGGTLELVLERLGAHSAVPELVTRLRARQLTRRSVSLRDGAVTLARVDRAEDIRLGRGRLVQVMGPGLRMLVIGAGELSRTLCLTAVGLGFAVTVCDPRESYADIWEDIPGVTLVRAMPDDAVLALQPDARTAVIALTHDPKLDDLALMEALASPAFYVGALGSRANNANRRERLRLHFEIDDAHLARLRGPAGLYIGSRTPPEIALSILAEVVAVKNGVVDVAPVGPAKDRLAPPSPACPTGTA